MHSYPSLERLAAFGLVLFAMLYVAFLPACHRAEVKECEKSLAGKTGELGKVEAAPPGFVGAEPPGFSGDEPEPEGPADDKTRGAEPEPTPPPEAARESRRRSSGNVKKAKVRRHAAAGAGDTEEGESRLADSLQNLGDYVAESSEGCGETGTVQVVDGKVIVQVYLDGKSPADMAKLKELGAEILLKATNPKMALVRVPVEKIQDIAGADGVWFVDYGFEHYNAIKNGEMRGVDVEKVK